VHASESVIHVPGITGYAPTFAAPLRLCHPLNVPCRTWILLAVVFAATEASAATLEVTSFADSGAGSLREALTAAINNDEWDSITFASSGTVGLTSPSCQKGMTCSLHINNGGTYDIVIDGSAIPRPNAGAHGLRISTSDVWVWDLTISGFEQTGVWIDGADTESVNVRGCRIGTDSTGTTTSANTVVGDAGVKVTGGAYAVYIYNNVIGGYVNRSETGYATGVHIDSNNLGERPQPVWLEGNIIGLTADGSAPLGGSGNGLEVGIHLHDTERNHIGDSDNMNTIGNQSFAGILVTGTATTNYINYNRVGTDITGTVAMPNGLGDPTAGGGIVVEAPAGGQFIGNILSGNVDCQVRFENSSVRPQLNNNVIGPAAGEPTVPLSNYGGGTYTGNVNGVCISNMDAQVSNNVIAFHTPTLNCPPACGAALMIQGSSWMSHVSGNSIGVVLDGGAVVGAAPNHYGLVLLDGPVMTDVYGNTVANHTQAGIAVVGSLSVRNNLRYNDLYDNGTDRAENVEICLATTLADCINHGYTAGSGRGNFGVLPPSFDSDLFTAPATIDPTAQVTITGTAAEGSVYLFRTPQPPATGGQGGSLEYFGPVTLDTAPYDFLLNITLDTDTHHCISAIYTDTNANSSELAPNVRVLFGDDDTYGAGPCRPPWTPPEPDGERQDGAAADGGARDGGDPSGGDPSGGDPTGGDHSGPTGDGYVIDSDGGPNTPPPCSPGFERNEGVCVRQLSCAASAGSGLAVLLLLLATVRARRERR